MPLSNIRVLVVDDDKDDRYILTRMLTKLGVDWTVEDVADVQAAREKIASECYDCVVLDYVLPGDTGLALAQEFLGRDKPPFIGFVMITGAGDENLAVEAMRAGVHDYVVKDHLTQNSLYRGVKNAIQATESAAIRYSQREVLLNFAGLVAHDVRSPLTSVLGFVELAQMEAEQKGESQIASYLDQAATSCRYMGRLVRSLLEYARAGSSDQKRELLDLNSIVDDVLMLCKADIEHANANITIEKLPKIRAVELEMLQLFQNLVSNAIRYAGEAPPSIHISCTSADGHFIIGIADKGIGVPKHKQEEIFKPLTRHADQDSLGLGLGLATCAKIMQGHEGKIWCERRDEGGSIFYLKFPLPH